MKAMDSLSFPDGFKWGVATAAYQVEGNNTNCQWHEWEEGHLAADDRSGLACDWWEHAEVDFDRAQALGVTGLRLSLEWSRIEPEEGRWDDAAIARYRAMLQGLRDRGIEPLVTLHHFTNPLWLERRGAFEQPAVVALFERYARHCVNAFGDLCDFWCTVNEPNVYAVCGYLIGMWPPGRMTDTVAALHVQGNLLRAHAAAYRAIHEVQPGARVGIAHSMILFDPAFAASPLDQFAAWTQDVGFNALVLHALARGRAPMVLRPFTGDLRAVRGTCDYLGLNYYTRQMVAFDPRRPSELFARRFIRAGTERMDGGTSLALVDSFGEIYPDGLRRVLLRLARYGKPIYVTENGFADVADRTRPRALVRTLAAMRAAIAQGAPIRGYYHWTLTDNFEWAEGWTVHFGLFAVNRVTQERTARASADVYRRICQANALPTAPMQDSKMGAAVGGAVRR
jgi:beta-glucosidase